jgi:hypothetical protein
MNTNKHEWKLVVRPGFSSHSWLEYPSLLIHYLKTRIEYAMDDAETRAAIEPRIRKLLSQNC